MKFSINFPAVFGLTLLLASGFACSAPELFWLSDSAPKKAQPSAVHAHGGADAVMNGEEADTIHNSTKRLWFRQGDLLRGGPGN